MKQNENFLKERYMKALFPIIISVLGGTINTLIDSAFVSQRLGNHGLAAVGMCMPLFLLFCTIGAFTADGSLVLCARAEGAKDFKAARSYFHTAVTFCILAGLVITVIGLVFCVPLASFLAQGGELTGYVLSYSRISFIGAIPSAFCYIPIYFLQFEGRGKEIIHTMLITIISDILLDWLLMFVFDFGIGGAAWASVFSIILSCAYSVWELQRGNENYRFSMKEAGLQDIGEILKFGSNAALRNILDAIKLFLLNAMILRAGGAGLLALWSVLNSLSEFSLCIVNGVSQTASPMIGVFQSTRENGSIRILTKLEVRIGECIAGVFTLALLLLHVFIEKLFVIGENMTFPLLCLGLSVMLELLCAIWGVLFTATGRLSAANLLMFCRKLVFPVSCVGLLILLRLYIWLFLPLSPFLSLSVVFFAVRLIARRAEKEGSLLSPVLLLDDSLERDGKVLDFSITPSPENICDASEKIHDFCENNGMESKQINRIGLAIEELLMVIYKKDKSLKSIDLRAFALPGNIGIRIRSAGELYDPFKESDTGDEDFYMGITMLKAMAQAVTHQYTLGLNTINIVFE